MTLGELVQKLSALPYQDREIHLWCGGDYGIYPILDALVTESNGNIELELI